jgi:hypothetical protein
MRLVRWVLSTIMRTGRCGGKLADRGRPCMVLGHVVLGRAADHSGDVYHFLNLTTNKVIKSQDVLWLNKMYGDWKGLDAIQREAPDEDGDFEFIDPTKEPQDFEPGREIQSEFVDVEVEETNEPTNGPILEMPAVPPKVARAMKKLGGFFNPEAQEIIESAAQAKRYNEVRLKEPDQAAGREEADVSAAVLIDRLSEDFDERETDYAFFVTEVLGQGPETERVVLQIMDFKKIPQSAWKDMFDNPTTYDEAWNHLDPWQRKKWREAITLEFKKMNDHKVWKKIPRVQMTQTRRCVKCKWIFKIKRNGIFRSDW